MPVLPKIIALTETYLSEDIMSEEILLPNYHNYRQDRNNLTSSLSTGGGVLIAVSKQLISTPIATTCICLEQKFVAISIGSSKIIVGVAYIPPNSPENVYELHAASVEEFSLKYPDHKLLLIGDYNFPNTEWVNDTGISTVSQGYLPPNLRDGISHLCTTFSYLQLYQHYPVHPAKGYTLDLVFSDIPGLSTPTFHDQLIKTDSHHEHLFIEISKCVEIDLQFKTHSLDFSRVNYSIVNEDLASIDWNNILSNNALNAQNLECKVNSFYESIYGVLRKFVPLKRLYSGNFPYWYSNELKDLIFQKKLAHILWKTFNLQTDYIEFKRIRAQCIRKSRTDYDQYICNTERYLKLT